MPSIGAATAMIVARRIDEAIEANFDEATRENAYRLLALSSKGGDRTYIIIIIPAVFGTLMTIFALLAANPSGFVVATAIAMISLLTLCWAVRRRKKARQELDALIASDREYWLPIAEKLEEIVLNAGRFDDGLLPRQATRIVR